MIVDAYYSEELKSWVRMVRDADGEWCHTSGYESYEDATGRPETKTRKQAPSVAWVHPCDTSED